MAARWKAVITYRSELPEPPLRATREVFFEEIADLHSIVESGPNFYAVEGIVITLNDASLATTLEAAERE